MPKSPTPFVQMTLEQMRGVGPVRARAMFGGWGIYCEDLMFALVAYDELYFKVDEHSRAEFENRNLDPFVYEANGKRVTMSYHRAPEDVFDDEDAMTHWATLAIDAAQRAKR
jgi:DNA transformation protein and related proteins